MKEIFKTIEDYPNYEVSNLGRIRNIKRDTFLKPFVVRRYYRVYLFNKGEYKSCAIHRIVAKAFLGNVTDMTVNHKNFNTLDNRLDNLEWMSLDENRQYSKSNNIKTFKEKIRIIYEQDKSISSEELFSKIMELY